MVSCRGREAGTNLPCQMPVGVNGFCYRHFAQSIASNKFGIAFHKRAVAGSAESGQAASRTRIPRRRHRLLSDRALHGKAVTSQEKNGTHQGHTCLNANSDPHPDRGLEPEPFRSSHDCISRTQMHSELEAVAEEEESLCRGVTITGQQCRRVAVYRGFCPWHEAQISMIWYRVLEMHRAPSAITAKMKDDP